MRTYCIMSTYSNEDNDCFRGIIYDLTNQSRSDVKFYTDFYLLQWVMYNPFEEK